MTVLLLGKHLELGLYRAEYLRSQGHTVIFPESKQEAVAAINTATYDAVILSYSLSHDSAIELRELIEQSCPICPVITLTEQPWPDQRIKSDKVVLVSDGPEALLNTINNLEKKGLRRVK